MKRVTNVFLVALILALFAGLFPDSAGAFDGVHMNGHYWDQWAYAPLTSVNAYDCVSQDQGIQTAATNWNNTGLVSVNNLGTCNATANGILWTQNSPGTGCGSYVNNDGFTIQTGVLDPDPQTPGTLAKDYHVTIYLGPTCGYDGLTTCAGYRSVRRSDSRDGPCTRTGRPLQP